MVRIGREGFLRLGLQPMLDDPGVLTGKGLHSPRINLCVIGFGRALGPVFGGLLQLLLHVLQLAHMAVVVNVRIGQGCIERATALVAVHRHPKLAIWRIGANGVAHQPAFAAVPGRAGGDPVRGAVKMQVIKHQRFYLRVGMVLVHALTDGGQFILMHQLIAF